MPDWPTIPKIPVIFTACEDGSLTADPTVDLGILGEWNVGGEFQLKHDPEMPLDEQIADVNAEVQIAFNRLLLRIAAVALVKRGEGVHPIMGWYEDALKDLELGDILRNKCEGCSGNMSKKEPRGTVDCHKCPILRICGVRDLRASLNLEAYEGHILSDCAIKSKLDKDYEKMVEVTARCPLANL